MISAGQFRVTMSDVDLVQLNFARPFQWMGAMHEELLRNLGHPLRTLLREGFATPVVETSCNFRERILHGDLIEVRTAITEVRNTSFVSTHRIERDGELCAIGTMRCVWVRTGEHHRPESPPEWLRSAQEPAGFALHSPGASG